MRGNTPSRRQVLGRVGAFVAGTAAQVRLVPRADLVNTLEYEQEAKRKLASPAYSLIAGGDRSAFDRITLRPRLLVPVLDMDLSVTLFGDAHFTPILVGPMAEQKRFHADGELATVKGASAAKAAMVVGSRSTVPIDVLAAQATTPLWYQVFPGDAAARTQIQNAVKAGCKAVCVTVAAPVDWVAVSALKRGMSVPLIVKGVATPAAARLALQHGADAIVVSNYSGLAGASRQSPILALPNIVDAVGGRVPVLADGSFRRGTDILKALAFGAKAVLVGRPIMWGLAAYGAEGVQGVIEMMQTELGRYMGQCGKSNLAMLDRTVVKVHGDPPR